MLESAIQTQIKHKLEKSGWLVNKMIQTSLNGWPDLECIKQGRVIYIEVKQPGKQPTDLQLYRHRQLRDHGMLILTAHSTKEIEHLCN
jgi:hypothetical protein